MLKEGIDFIFYSAFVLDPESKLISSLNFFVYDSIKILLLLFFMIAIVAFLRSYVRTKDVRRKLEKSRFGHLIASSFGALTPFCSCSSIPIFLSFIRARIPLGIAFSFLITSPLVNEYLVVLMFGFFGWKITLIYVISGILLGVIGGMILGRLRLEGLIVDDISARDADKKFNNIKERIRYGIDESISIVRKLWVWILLGVGLGAIIHNYVPSETIQGIVAAGGVFAVPLAVLMGVPMYGSCAAIVPIALVLFNKGVPLGTALAFMMATAALSLPEAVILRRAIRIKLILMFFALVTLGIVFTGYVFNLLAALL